MRKGLIPWKPGESGNPDNLNMARRGENRRVFQDALKRAIAQRDLAAGESGATFRELSEVLINCAMAGKDWAMQLLFERLDGKVSQEITVKREVRDMSLEDILAELAALRATADVGGGDQTGPEQLESLH